LTKFGWPLEELKAVGLGPAVLKELRESGFSASDLVQAEGHVFLPHVLRDAGYSAKELSDAGLSLDELQATGFSPNELQHAHIC